MAKSPAAAPFIKALVNPLVPIYASSLLLCLKPIAQLVVLLFSVKRTLGLEYPIPTRHDGSLRTR